MKFCVCIALFAAVFSVALADPTSNSGSAAEQEAKAEQNVQGVNLQSAYDLTRFRKSAYGGGAAAASIPAPPCPKNYLISCQPNLAPIPCAAPATYGSAGAYSAPIPSYVYQGVDYRG